MSADDAARIRADPAVRVLDGGTDNINRVVATRDFGLVIDRRRRPRRSAVLTGPPPALPTPHFEHDVLRNLKAAGASFAQDIHYADGTGLILQYIDGQTFTDDRWYSDAELRGEYTVRLPEVMGELADIAPAVTPRVIHPAERGFWPERVESAAHFGQIMHDRTILVWDRVVRGSVTGLLRAFGDTEHVGARLAGFEVTGDRPVTFLHNDLHPWNTVRSPFTVVDWTNASAGDALWDATMARRTFRTDAERDRFMANLHAELPSAMFNGFAHDWAQYQVLFQERSRTMSAGFIAEQAAQALHAVARATTPEARREALRPFAEEIHLLSGSFSGRPLERSLEETTDLVMAHVKEQLGLRTPVRTGRRGRAASRETAVAVIGHERGDIGPSVKPGPPQMNTATRNSAVSPRPWASATTTASTGTDTGGAPVGSGHTAANLSVVGSGLGPVADKLSAPTPSSISGPGAAVNVGGGRIPSRIQTRELRAHPVLGLTRSRQPGHG